MHKKKITSPSIYRILWTGLDSDRLRDVRETARPQPNLCFRQLVQSSVFVIVSNQSNSTAEVSKNVKHLPSSKRGGLGGILPFLSCVSKRIHFFFFFIADLNYSVGATSQVGRRSPHCWGLYITHNATHARAHPVGLLWKSDQLIAGAATYTTFNWHKIRTCMPSAGFEQVTPATKHPHGHLERRWLVLLVLLTLV